MNPKNRSALFQSEADQSTAKLFESNSNLDATEVKFNSKQEEARIRSRNVKIIKHILETFNMEETKRKYETQNVVEYVLDPNAFAYDCSLSTTRVRQRLCNLMGTDVIRLNDKRYFQKLSERLQEEYEVEMDKEEDARVASENERLRRLMLEGIIDNPHDYRAIIHGEHTKHKRTKKKKRRSRRKKRIDSAQETEGGTTMTSQLSDEEGEKEEEQDEIVTQVEILSRPSSSAGTKSRQRGSGKKDRRSALEEKDDEKENEDERRFSEMHVPPPHRPSSSCSLRRKRLKSAAPRVSHWDNNRHSSEESEQESDTETKSLPDPRRIKEQSKYNKTEKPLVKTLRREETVAGLYAIAEELISPVKTELSDKKVMSVVNKPKKKKMTVMY